MCPLRRIVAATAVLPVLAVGIATPRAAGRSTTGPGEIPADARVEVFKQVGDVRLRLYVFVPEDHQSGDRRAAIVFFFGGGWLRGSPAQFAPQCRYLAARGMVALTAEYRTWETHRATIADAVADAQSALRWTRANAGRLGIDPNRLAAGGGSAGGHLAAAVAFLRDFTRGEDASVCFRPNALVLFNPVLDLRAVRPREQATARNPGLHARLGAETSQLSPAAHIGHDAPPTIIFHGKSDRLIPLERMEEFARAVRAAGGRCELVGFEGAGHGFFNAGGKDGFFDETMRRTERFLASLSYFGGSPSSRRNEPAGPRSTAPGETPYLEAARTFAENVLRYGRDTYGPTRTPLLADGIHVETHAPAIWRLPPELAESWRTPREWTLSNLASQQNLFRVLVGLSQVTGDPRYKRVAVEITRYAVDHLRHESGLFYWGGHSAIDLVTEQKVGEGRNGGKHELKRHYPFYELMWEVDPAATRRFIEAFWANHILRWDILDMNRHGNWRTFEGSPWDHAYAGGPTPFVGEGLTFSNTGSDLFYAAAMLYRFTGDERPLTWAKRLARKYVEARHPVTGLGADNYSEERTRRIVQQFGPEFGERCTEATITSLYGTRYACFAICQLRLSERLGPPGEEFKRWALEDLTAYARHAYDPSDNTFWMTLIDGTRLKPEDVKRPGYVRPEQFRKRPVESLNFWAYALAWKLTDDALMWDMTRRIAIAFDLGEFGDSPGEPGRLNLQTPAADPYLIFALLDLHERTGQKAWLSLACRIADNLLARQFRNGLFVAGPGAEYARFDSVTPLALLHLDVAVRGLNERLPVYAGGQSYFHCTFEGQGRTYDNQAIYGISREARRPSTQPAQRSGAGDGSSAAGPRQPTEAYHEAADDAPDLSLADGGGRRGLVDR